MVQNDVHAAIITFDKAPSLVDDRQFVGLIGKDNIAQRHRCVTSDDGPCVFNFAFGPSLQGEACVFWERGITADEI